MNQKTNITPFKVVAAFAVGVIICYLLNAADYHFHSQFHVYYASIIHIGIPLIILACLVYNIVLMMKDKYKGYS